MTVISWIVTIFSAGLAIGAVYLYLLAVIGAVKRPRPIRPVRRFRFLIVVPAHNEGEHLKPTLENLAALPSDQEHRIVVVADNCTDNTAEIARSGGAEVFERNDLERRGKGYALEWIIDQIGLEQFDVMVVIDADTRVEGNLLEVLTDSFEQGAAAVQTGNYVVPDREDSPLSTLQYMASLVENRLFYEPRARLGLHGLLRGTGMALRSDLLSRFPWDSHSVTEDVDYAVKILKAGERVDFTAATSVRSGATVDYGQTATQKTRWASGTFALIADHFPGLLRHGLTGRPRLLELAFALLLLSRPLMIYLATGLLVISVVLLPAPFWSVPAALNLGVIVLLVVYLMLGGLLLRDRSRAWRAIAATPFYGLWFLGVQVRSALGMRRTSWNRTERKDDAGG